MPEDSFSEYPSAYRYRRIVQSKRYIDIHFREPINLEMISDEACFSKFHFLRLFKNAYGRTPNQYLMGLRIRYAKKMLKENIFSISEICLEVGFESPGSFSSLFKRETGKSPSEYRMVSKKSNSRWNQNPAVSFLTVLLRLFSKRAIFEKRF